MRDGFLLWGWTDPVNLTNSLSVDLRKIPSMSHRILRHQLAVFTKVQSVFLVTHRRCKTSEYNVPVALCLHVVALPHASGRTPVKRGR